MRPDPSADRHTAFVLLALIGGALMGTSNVYSALGAVLLLLGVTLAAGFEARLVVATVALVALLVGLACLVAAIVRLP